MAKPRTVAEYVEGLDDWRGEAVSRLRRLVLEAAPDAKESIKWARPVYEVNGPLCYIMAFKNHVNLGFQVAPSPVSGRLMRATKPGSGPTAPQDRGWEQVERQGLLCERAPGHSTTGVHGSADRLLISPRSVPQPDKTPAIGE